MHDHLPGQPKQMRCDITLNNSIVILIVYREGDIVKQPMKKGSSVPKNVPGVGWVGWVMQGWGGS